LLTATVYNVHVKYINKRTTYYEQKRACTKSVGNEAKPSETKPTIMKII